MTDAQDRWEVSRWQLMFEEIYGHANRAAGEVNIGFRMLEEVGEVVRECRAREPKQVRYHLPDVFAWLCALCSVRELRLTEVAWDRYQAGCPTCRQIPCLCPPTKSRRGPTLEEPTKRGAPRKRQVSTQEQFTFRDWTLLEWERHLEAVYGDRNDSLDWIDVAARVSEHAGAVAKVIRQRQNITELKKETANVFAWSIALWNCLQAQSATENKSFAALVFDKYPNYCPLCLGRPCKCPRPVARLFISSQMRTQEATALRAAAREAVVESRLEPIMFEDFNAQFFFDPQAEALRRLDECDVLVIVLEKALTKPVYSEFYTAAARDIPIWVFLLEGISQTPA